MKRTASLYIAWLVAAVLLVFAATGRHPYSFYTLLRWICCAVFVYSAFTAHQQNRIAWAWIFGVLAVLYNPIFRVHLDRSTWASVNWFTVGAIAVASAFFWPRSTESNVSLSEDKIEISNVSRRAVAREWLIFLAVLPLGFATCFFLGFYQEQPSDLSGAYDYFWNAHFGLGSVSSLALWLAPYLVLMLVRSILWSLSTLWRGRNLKRGVLYSFLAVYLIAALWFGALLVKNVQYQAATRPDATLKESHSANLEVLQALGKGDVNVALKLAQSLVKRSPQDSAAHSMLGDVYSRAGFTDDAIVQYQEAIKLEPNSGLSAGDWEKLGELYSSQNRERDAFAAYLQAAALCEAELRTLDTLPSWSLTKEIFRPLTLSQLGKAYQNTNQPAKAKNAYLQSIELDNKNPDAWQGLGDLAAESGDEQAATAAYLHARSDDNSEASAWELLSFYYLDKKRDNDAARCWLKAESLRNAHR